MLRAYSTVSAPAIVPSAINFARPEMTDSGVPSYDENMARKFSNVGVPCFGCTPTMLPPLLEGALKGQDLKALAERCGVKPK